MRDNKKRIKRGRYEQLAYIGIILGITLFVIGGTGYTVLQYRYRTAQNKYDDLSSVYVEVHDSAPLTTTDNNSDEAVEYSQPAELHWYEVADINISNLKKEYRNVVGWLYFEDGTINYPIMYSDNEVYLTHAYDGSYSASGSVFMDMNNHSDLDDPYTILYGHNMKDGSMFRPLKNYQSQEYLNVFPYFQIITEDAKYRYQIVAVNTISMYSDYYDISYSRDSLMNSRLDKLIRESAVKGSISAGQEDYILNLSTCSGSDNRLFVTAVRIDTANIK